MEGNSSIAYASSIDTVEAKRDTQVTQERNRLKETADTLLDAVTRLENRLSNYMRPSDVPTSPGGPEEAPPTVYSANALRDITLGLEGGMRRVNYILDHFEG